VNSDETKTLPQFYAHTDYCSPTSTPPINTTISAARLCPLWTKVNTGFRLYTALNLGPVNSTFLLAPETIKPDPLSPHLMTFVTVQPPRRGLVALGEPSARSEIAILERSRSFSGSLPLRLFRMTRLASASGSVRQCGDVPLTFHPGAGYRTPSLNTHLLLAITVQSAST